MLPKADGKESRPSNFSTSPTSSFTVPNSGSRALKWYLKLPCLSTAALKSRSVTSPSLSGNTVSVDLCERTATETLTCHFYLKKKSVRRNQAVCPFCAALSQNTICLEIMHTSVKGKKNNTLLYKPTVKCIYFHLFGMLIRNGVSERSVKYSTLVETAVSNPGLLCEWAISGSHNRNGKQFFPNQSLK